MTRLALATSGLRRSFGRVEVLKGLDLAVPKGTIYGFLGRNGAGKTTAIRSIMGILAPDAGTISFDGAPVRRTTAAMRRGIGYVSQQQHFYPWMTVRRLAAFVGPFYGKAWSTARFEDLCDLLAVPQHQRVGELSGGTRMKLALALSLGHSPPLLVLDEPTAGVDPVTRREMLDLLRTLAQKDGVTVFFSTHQISEIEDIGDQVGILHDGRVFWQGPVAGATARVARTTAEIDPRGDLQVLHRDEKGAVVWGEPGAIAALGGDAVSLEAAFVAIARQDTRP